MKTVQRKQPIKEAALLISLGICGSCEKFTKRVLQELLTSGKLIKQDDATFCVP